VAISGNAQHPQAFAGSFNGNVSFSGNVTVSGTISKANSSFQIDHPLDPANKYLRHAAVESDQMKNLYDGVVKLNRKGEAEVRVPRWFSGLNRDLRYQLTPIGGPAPNLHIGSPLQAGKFRIAGGKPGLLVSWQVTGVRQDRWAKANPLAVEAPKDRRHRGKYLHPTVFGRKREDGIGWIGLPKSMRALSVTPRRGKSIRSRKAAKTGSAHSQGRS
jgi:hypothetical protein